MKHLLAALGVGIVLAAASGVASAEVLGDPQAGFEYAQTYCATCHGIRKNRLCLRPLDFRNVADQPGITATALQVWMQTHHAQHHRRAERHA